MYTLDYKKRYHILNNNLYEDDIPILFRRDKAWMTIDWKLNKKAALDYIQSDIYNNSRRFDKHEKIEKVKLVTNGQIELW